MEGLEQWKDQLEQLKSQLEPWKNQLEKCLHEAIEYLNQIPPVQLYAAIAVLLISTLLLLSIRLFKCAKSNTIILTGLSGSGKTVLFYQGTITSMEPNESTIMLNSDSNKRKSKPVHIVDIPGHSRLRPKLDEFLPRAAGIVFVVDSLEFLPNCRLASEYLYDILTKASVVKKKIPVLICCNKNDKVTAHTKEFIRKQMEKEIDKLRASRSAISAADISNDFTLGVPEEPFTFSQCRNKVTVAESSGLTGEVGQVEQFIWECVKP
ncbi:hypothetical protein E1A91_A03G002300v1 [Gossypium mustelinum]|uniref:Signal recognition particle receptor subunit beta n=1 Tax=Gossypium mustelinum TaxID=34275 RepID=A0A5D2ZQG6_GOSMU|nr:hypothetical protein E1A91_A03G002300v1 [Gossypium mustelinum]